MQEFQLRVVPTGHNNFAVELYQCAYKRAGEKRRPAARRIGRLKGQALVLSRMPIYTALKQNHYDPKTLSCKRKKPYILDESSGICLGLLFRALQRLRKLERIANIAAGVEAMTQEEAHYWFAKIESGQHPSALRALRVLLGE
ncbi:hypothetical protein NEA10_19355 [Phormidium yuhuli AB48]|uniref:DUF7680 domain-containing protein n=1 Tax=Phormidium yuhuli AB48 TaxID=2940671 RepID=A0ABY5AQ04_9CYAN|nr:hypothetical protein [Phormidium yuhuli]USR90953.1 hypothetical protein NEA10_19355 [Phormidium yuhuli AB48]